MEMRDSIKALRMRRGMTQAMLADLLEVDQSTVTKWETGASRPYKKYQRKLCEVFNCTMGELLGLDSI